MALKSPFNVPASSWNQEIFEQNWPCIRLRRSKDLRHNPWEGGRVKDFTLLKEICRLMQRDLERSANVVKTTGGEMNNRTRTQGLVTLLSQLAMPDVDEAEGAEDDSASFKEGVDAPPEVSAKEERTTPPAAAGAGTTEEQAASKDDSPGSSRGPEWEHESTEGIGRQSMDWLASVIDKAIRRAGCSRKYATCAKLIWEMKAFLLKNWADGPGGRWQLTKYMVIHALLNGQKVPARLSAIYGLCFNLKEWAGEVFQLKGTYKIGEDGFIIEASLLNFSSDDKAWIRKRVEWQRQVLRQTYDAKPEAKVYPVGTLYSMQEVRTFVPGHESGVRIEPLQLVEGLLRCAVGERVCEWTWPDVKRKLEAAEEEVERSIKKRMVMLDDKGLEASIMEEYSNEC
ncbi:hypothetical protein KFL_003870120 [Klebsormidium nitens]|uniref:Uncharacterized protein n=1 Tax=Klebsormidium nitens TaxID=105231 RepID=A0A1Y1IAD3_KLENI|nr:hypothetical protein KFL_003870120 [Klebsormidium nitens]|eukprot:GAQ87915.1 hypothetical protein KFL_003870120 [Klebsormidium nitens]